MTESLVIFINMLSVIVVVIFIFICIVLFCFAVSEKLPKKWELGIQHSCGFAQPNIMVQTLGKITRKEICQSCGAYDNNWQIVIVKEKPWTNEYEIKDIEENYKQLQLLGPMNICLVVFSSLTNILQSSIFLININSKWS